MTETITQIHATWQRMTGQQINLRAVERLIYDFIQCDFTNEDMECLLNYMLAHNRKNPNAQFRINMSKILGDMANCASLVAESKAKERNRKKPPTPQQKVMQAFSPIVCEDVTTTATRSLVEVFQTIAKK